MTGSIETTNPISHQCQQTGRDTRLNEVPKCTPHNINKFSAWLNQRGGLTVIL